MMKRVTLSILLIAAATSATARQFAATDRKSYELPMFIAGSFQVENPFGDIEVIGTDDTKATVVITRVITAADDAGLNEGQKMTGVAFTGDERQRIVRTWISPMQTQRWSPNVSYSIRVPRTAQVAIFSNSSNRIHVSDIRGLVRVKNINGEIRLERVGGPIIVDSANGNVVYLTPDQVNADVVLSTINGTVDVFTPNAATFRWEAQSARGDIRTNIPVRGNFDGSNFRGYVNAPGGATIRTLTLLGAVAVLKNGSNPGDGRLLGDIPAARQQQPPPSQVSPVVSGPIRMPAVQTSYEVHRSMGDISIGEIAGDATITTGAGMISLGLVRGECQADSGGGPLNFGEISRVVNAHTDAGDVVIQSAREGGTVTTGGGIIRILYAGGPVRLQSGGGDIMVNSVAPVTAETRSGDIAITLDRAAKSQRVNAKTAKGSITLNVGGGFAADIEATVITTDPDANTIRSDFTGLSVQREQIGNKIRIRATGKINGGGERVELSAENGGIQITSSRP